MSNSARKNCNNQRIWTPFTPEQIKVLEKVIEETLYPDGQTISKLSVQLQLNERRIHVWFQNRRAKYRKDGTLKYSVKVTKSKWGYDGGTEKRNYRRNRKNFTPEQVKELEKVLEETQYPDYQTRNKLSMQLQVDERKIQVWFQNRREKIRKHGPVKKLVKGPKNRDRQDDLVTRTKLTPEQVKELEKVFEETRYPDYQTRHKLSAQLQLNERSIQVWFQNRRIFFRDHGTKKKRVTVKAEKRIDAYCSRKLELAKSLISDAENTYRLTANRRQLIKDVSNICLLYLMKSLNRIYPGAICEQLVNLITSMHCFQEDSEITDEIFENMKQVFILGDPKDSDNEFCHADDTVNVLLMDNESVLASPVSHSHKDKTANASRKASVGPKVAAEDVAAMAENTSREAEFLGRYARRAEIAENGDSERGITYDSGVNSSCQRNEEKPASKGKISEVLNKSPNKKVKTTDVFKNQVHSADYCITNVDTSVDGSERNKLDKGHILEKHTSLSRYEFIDVVHNWTETSRECELEHHGKDQRKVAERNLKQFNQNENKTEKHKDAEFSAELKENIFLLDILDSSGEPELEHSIFDKIKEGTETDLRKANTNAKGEIKNVSSSPSCKNCNEVVSFKYRKTKDVFSDILGSSSDSELEYSANNQIKHKIAAKSRKKNHRASEEARLNGIKEIKNGYPFLIAISSDSDLASEKAKKGTKTSLKKAEKIRKKEHNKLPWDSKCVTGSDGLGKSREKKKKDVFSFIFESEIDSDFDLSISDMNTDKDLNETDSYFERGNDKSSEKTKKKRNFFGFLDEVEIKTKTNLEKCPIELRNNGIGRKTKSVLGETTRKKKSNFIEFLEDMAQEEALEIEVGNFTNEKKRLKGTKCRRTDRDESVTRC